MNERTAVENLHCALKHAWSLVISFIEIIQKAELLYEQTKNNKKLSEEIKEYTYELYKLKSVIEDIIAILEQAYFLGKKLSFEDLNHIKVNLRIIRNKIEIETRRIFSKLGDIQIKEKNLVENAFFDDFRVLMSNLVHLEIHLAYITSW